MAKRPLTPTELHDHLRMQVTLLTRSAQWFDSGHVEEAQRIGVAIRNLVYDRPPNSRSVLGQLGVKDTTTFFDSSFSDSLVHLAGAAEASGLVALDRTTAEFVAPLETVPFRPVSFDQWWTTPVIGTSSGRVFARSELVMTISNNDGGAHVDPDIEVDYAAFRQDHLDTFYADHISPAGELLPTAVDPSTLRRPTGNVASASVRQIGAELLAAIAPLLV